MKYPIFIFLLLLGSTVVGQKSDNLASMRDLDYGVQTHFINLNNDVELAYSETGTSGDYVIFIHGLASYLPAWKKNVETLSKNNRCITIDLPGYGRSSKGNYPISMDFFADIIQEFCVKKGIQSMTLVGHSMGGQIAITAALKYPKLVAKLVLIAPAGFETFNKGQRQWFRDVMSVDGVKLTTVEQIRINYAFNFYDMPDDAQFMVADRIAIRAAKDFEDYCYHITQGVGAMVDQPVFEFLHLITQPTLCIFGENDNLIPNRYLNGGYTSTIAKSGAEKIPNCTLEMVPKAGHFVMFEKSDVVNQHIKEFLQK